MINFEKLKLLAASLGYRVRKQRIQEMTDDEWALFCPDSRLIYLSPEDPNIVETLAHELGHVILCDMDVDIAGEEGEYYANLIGISLCLALKVPPRSLFKDVSKYLKKINKIN